MRSWLGRGNLAMAASRRMGIALAGCLGLFAASAPARADFWDALDLDGSLGAAGGHHRYVPAISNPLFNETPYITTELRPLYLHNDIPSGFITQGGHIDAGAVEA